MTKVLMLFLISRAGIAATGELKPVPFTRGDYTLQATTDKGDTLLEARDILVEVRYPSGKEARGDLLVFFDKSRGHFLWHYTSLYRGMMKPERRLAEWFTHDSIAYVEDDRIVIWRMLGVTRLSIDESSKRAASLDDAEAKALREATAQLEKIEKGSGWIDYKEVSLNLTTDFAVPKNSPIAGPVKLFSVSKQDGKWEVMIQGQWTVKAILNHKYELMDVQRIQ